MNNFSAVSTLFDTVVKHFQSNMQHNLEETLKTWNVNSSPCKKLLFEFALHEKDQNYLNVFLIPDGTCGTTRKIALGYKIGGIMLDSGKVYQTNAPYGIDTYESRFVVATFQIKV